MTGRVPFLAPEVLQTSGMDCGPAVLGSLLGSHGIRANYDRLREACRTAADGTSIDSLEDVCRSLGLDAYQEIVPGVDLVDVLQGRRPSIIVTVLPTGAPHFVVFWRSFFGWVQLMDPGGGRRWVRRERLLRELYIHDHVLDPSTFRQWFSNSAWHARLRRRLAALEASELLQRAEQLPLNTLGAIDQAARMAEELGKGGQVSPAARRALLQQLVSLGETEPSLQGFRQLRSIRQDEDGNVLVRAATVLFVEPQGSSASAPQGSSASAPQGTRNPALATELTSGKRKTELAALLSVLSKHAYRAAILVACLALLVTLLTLGEMLLLRAAFNAKSLLSLPQQRLGGASIYAGVVLGLLALEFALDRGVQKLSRQLELRVWVAMLKKLPKLEDAYFRSRPIADITERSSGLFNVRLLPEIAVTIARRAVDLLITAVALTILYPSGWGWIVLALVFAVLLPLLVIPSRNQLERRVLAHGSSLGRVYLDTLLGLLPMRAHGAEPALRADHEGHLADWRTETRRSIELFSLTDAVQSAGTVIALLGLFVHYLQTDPGHGALLLLAFWALRLPHYARSLSTAVQRLPVVTAATGRLLEPLLVPTREKDDAPAASVVASEPAPSDTQAVSGVRLDFDAIGVLLSGREVLSRVSVRVHPGEHIAVVGSSGAGKSTLVGVLLGLIEPSSGQVRIDGVPLHDYGAERLRREAVWVDPTVQLWNEPLFDNLRFGNPAEQRRSLQETLELSLLKDVVTKLPEGIATPLGESGCSISGGEGQRVRIGRAMMRAGARLILLDEAFRGLERGVRRKLSRELRHSARSTTLLEVTHDVAETTDFDRIFVIEDGALVEAGTPAALLATAGSRYAELVATDQSAQERTWSAGHWRRLELKAATSHSESHDAA
jgi:ABC-type bacteriocin/lantibiotic exporter with double-glycine peptidase domain